MLDSPSDDAADNQDLALLGTPAQICDSGDPNSYHGKVKVTTTINFQKGTTDGLVAVKALVEFKRYSQEF